MIESELKRVVDIKDVEDVKGRKRTCINFKIWVTSSESTFMISFDLVTPFFSRFNLPLRPRIPQSAKNTFFIIITSLNSQNVKICILSYSSQLFNGFK